MKKGKKMKAMKMVLLAVVAAGVQIAGAGGAFADASDSLYRVVDLSAGPATNRYPVTSLSAVPAGGWTDEYKTTKLVLRYIEPGAFTMGSPSNELGRCADEVPHKVTLTKGFYIGVFPVTQRQWELVMGDRPSHFRDPKLYATRPVETVSYDRIRGAGWGAAWPSRNTVDAKSFLGILRAKTKIDFDLPTEAQWEYACRAGTASAFNSGKDLTSTNECANMAAVGRYFRNGGDEERGGGTAKVGSFAPNVWGLYDMHGNICEWCLDWWSETLADATDPKGAPRKSQGRVCRGGCWFTKSAQFCRSASRAYYPPSGGYYLGLRLAAPAPVEPARKAK